MLDVEAGLDDTDRRIFTLLMIRSAYSTAAACIPDDCSKIFDQRHTAAKLRRLQKAAREHALDPDSVKRIYAELFEASIKQRHKILEKLKRNPPMPSVDRRQKR